MMCTCMGKPRLRCSRREPILFTFCAALLWSIYVSWEIHPTPIDGSVAVAQIPDCVRTNNSTSEIVALEILLAQLTRELDMAKTLSKHDRQQAEQLKSKLQSLEPMHTSTNKSEDKKNTTDICHHIPPLPKDWVKNIGMLINASQDQQYDPNYVLRDLNALVLEFITPRLPRSAEGFPQHNQNQLLRKIQARYDYLGNPEMYRNNKISIPPPIRIYISGGSVADGQNCGTPLAKAMAGPRCSWPRKLQVLINNLVGGDMVEIINGARGGANSQMGRAILAYVPPHQFPLDVVINAHSVNDQIQITREGADHYNMSVKEYTLEMSQNFTRFILHHHPNATLIWLEDYLGNERRNLLELQEFSKQIHTLSKYYGFGVVSYTDMIRDVVYGDTRETALTPNWYDPKETTMVREVHPGIVMHVCVAYMFLHYGWSLMQQACSGYDQISISYNSTAAHEVDKGVQWPLPRPEGVPPKLSLNLSLEDISDLWRITNTSSSVKFDAAVGPDESCPFQWTAGLQKEKKLDTLGEDSQKLFAPYLQTPTTWELIHSDFGKGRVGWAHYESPANSSRNEQQPLRLVFPFSGIQTIALFVAKNNDPDWANSSALVTIQKEDDIVLTQRIRGYHRSTDDPIPPDRPKKRRIRLRMTKQVYLVEVDLSKVVSNSTAANFTFQLEHASGVGFKLMGMALCRFPPVMNSESTVINNW